ncbi:multidrug effflux MFS transporter [Oricola sp.]|uniref:multidrug effflux MFS transporter n=1 Tax=Oricola sp. TaxID=1979950 RepID=UPI003BA998F0
MSKSAMSERRVALISAALVSLGPASIALYSPAMPEMVADFGTTTAGIKATMTAFFGGLAFAQLIAGPLADAFGRRTTTLVFVGIYIVSSIAALLAPTVEVLIAARLAQGIGASIGVTTARAVVRDLFPGDAGARIMNVIAMIIAIAPMLSPVIGGMVVAVSGWHAIFALMVVFGAAVFAMAYLMLRETTVPDRANIRGAEIGRNYLRLLANREFLSAAIVMGASIGTIQSSATIMPFVLIDTVGLSPAEFGLFITLPPTSFLAGSIAFRLLSRRFGPAQLVFPGLIALSAGSALIAVWGLVFGPSTAAYVVPLCINTFGIALVLPHMSIAGLRGFPRIAGSASALTGFFQMGAGFVGGMLAALFASPAIATSVIFPAFALICATAYGIYLRAAAAAVRHEAAARPVSAE